MITEFNIHELEWLQISMEGLENCFPLLSFVEELVQFKFFQLIIKTLNGFLSCNIFPLASMMRSI